MLKDSHYLSIYSHLMSALQRKSLWKKQRES